MDGNQAQDPVSAHATQWLSESAYGLAPRLSGKVNVRAGDLQRLSEWISPAAPEWMSRMRTLPIRALELAGDMDVSPSGFAGRNLTINVDRSNFEGTLALSDAFGTRRSNVVLRQRL